VLCCYRLLIMAKPLIPSYFWYRWVHTVLTQLHRDIDFNSKVKMSPLHWTPTLNFFSSVDVRGLFGSLVVIYIEQIIIYLSSYVTRFTMYG